MRIIIMSDTHGNFKALESIIMRNSDADWFFHLGDGESDVDHFLANHPEMTQKVIQVAGNCDIGSMSPGYFVLPVGEHSIFATHGHFYAVKNDLSLIKKTAGLLRCDIVLFGHTHIRYNKYEDGMYVFNPGSASCPHDGTKSSFGCLDISPAGILLNIADV